MKKYVLPFMAMAAASLVLAACGSSAGNSAVAGPSSGAPAPETSSEAGRDTSRLTVYTSFYPMYDFAKKVGGDKIELTNLVPAGTEPHDWEPATTDITGLENADMLIYNGAGMEHWVDKVLDSLENKDLVAVQASEGVELMEGHHGHDDEEEEEDGEHEEEESGYDPHVWISIKNAKIEMETIKNALAEADPDNAQYYEDNYKEYAAKFDELDAAYAETLAALPNKDIIVAHQAFGYLCRDYGLNQVAIEGLSPDSEPDPARMAEIIRFAKDNHVTTIFFEELVSPKVAETIAKELGAKTDVLNPVEGLTDEQLAAGKDYLSVMADNLEALKAALQ